MVLTFFMIPPSLLIAKVLGAHEVWHFKMESIYPSLYINTKSVVFLQLLKLTYPLSLYT